MQNKSLSTTNQYSKPALEYLSWTIMKPKSFPLFALEDSTAVEARLHFHRYAQCGNESVAGFAPLLITPLQCH